MYIYHRAVVSLLCSGTCPNIAGRGYSHIYIYIHTVEYTLFTPLMSPDPKNRMLIHLRIQKQNAYPFADPKTECVSICGSKKECLSIRRSKNQNVYPFADLKNAYPYVDPKTECVSIHGSKNRMPISMQIWKTECVSIRGWKTECVSIWGTKNTYLDTDPKIECISIHG